MPSEHAKQTALLAGGMANFHPVLIERKKIKHKPAKE